MHRTCTIIAVYSLLLCLQGESLAADIVLYVDTGAAAGGDGTTNVTPTVNDGHQPYQSLTQCEAAADGVYEDLVTAGNTMTIHCNRTNGGGVDTERAYFDSSWITDATHTLTIMADDFPADGVFDDTKYYLHNNDNLDTGTLLINTNYATVDRMQVVVTSTSTNSRNGIVFTLLASGANEVTVSNCIIKGVPSGTGSSYGIFVNDNDGILTMFNTVVYGFSITDNTGFRGVSVANVSTISNCTIYDCWIGIYGGTGGASFSVTNSAIFGCGYSNGDIVASTKTVTYCATDDNVGTSAVDLNDNASGEWTASFTNYGAGIFTVKDASAPIYNTGTDNPGSGLYTDDLANLARTTTWDIGAFEYDDSEAPAGTGQVIMMGSLIPLLLIFARLRQTEARLRQWRGLF